MAQVKVDVRKKEKGTSPWASIALGLDTVTKAMGAFDQGKKTFGSASTDGTVPGTNKGVAETGAINSSQMDAMKRKRAGWPRAGGGNY